MSLNSSELAKMFHRRYYRVECITKNLSVNRCIQYLDFYENSITDTDVQHKFIVEMLKTNSQLS